MKLPPLIEAIETSLDLWVAPQGYDIVNEIRNKIQFYKESLELWQFMPCDKETGEPLDKPNNYDDWKINGTSNKHSNNFCKQYQKAEQRVLFTGFEIDKGLYNGIYYRTLVSENYNINYNILNDSSEMFYSDNENDCCIDMKSLETIQDLCSKVELADWKAIELKLK